MSSDGDRWVGELGGDQFFVTHCTTADNILNAPGYGVRAASTGDPTALHLALAYPPYQLPFALWKDKPLIAQTPRRLARSRDSAGWVWVVQSTHLPHDTMGRDRSYFSHLLRVPVADPKDVLRSWASLGWATSYPQGVGKVLAANPKLPSGPLVSDKNLTAFLNRNPPDFRDLSTTVCPPRLRESTATRRDIFARVLYALLLSKGEHGRRRVYVHAEPGLIALLLYGAIRLLPDAVTADLTFSTYEPPQSNIRDYTLADVVGTYLGAEGAGLEPDLAARGLVLDTFLPAKSSPVLSGAVPRDLLSAVDTAAAGHWAPVSAQSLASAPELRAKPEPLASTSEKPAASPLKPVEPDELDELSQPDEPRAYSAAITRTNPACLLLLIDQSGSMNEPFTGGAGRTKAVVVADAVNRLLQNVVLRSAKADGVRDYFHVGVIGYGTTIRAGLGGSIPSDILIPISRLGAFPLRVENRKKLSLNNFGGVVEEQIKFPVWFDPEAGGTTPMCEALGVANLAVKEFIEKFPDAYPPLILNLTDGIPSDGNPQEDARQLRQLATSDGNVLLFNLLLSSTPVEAEYFPADESMMADNFSKLLFRMSSKLPPNLWAAAKAEGHKLKPDARGVVLNADPTAIVRFLDIGTRITRPTSEEHSH